MSVNHKNSLLRFLYGFLLGGLYSFVLSSAVMHATVLEYPALHLLGMCMLLSALFGVCFYNKYTTLAFGVGLAGVVVALLFFSLGPAQPPFEHAAWYQTLRSDLGELAGFFLYTRPYREKYSRLVAMGTAFLITGLTVGAMQRGFRFALLAMVGGLVVALPVYMDWGSSDRVLFLFIVCILAMLMKKLNLIAVRRREGKGADNPVFALAVIPLCLLVTGISWMLPRPDLELKEREPGRQLLDAAENIIYGNSEDQILSFTDNEEPLGGPLSMNEQFIMEVAADERIYLGGRTRDTYTGSSWKLAELEQTRLQAENNGRYDIALYTGDLLSAQEYYMRYYGVTMKQATVDTAEVRTRTLYRPAFSATLQTDSDLLLSVDSEGSLSSWRPLGDGVQYTVDYISWNYSNPYFIAMLQGLPTDAESVPGRYLQLPESLPGRVKALAEELTADAGSDYAKVMAITRYLSRFPYTLSPETPPAGVDFVDYFLFTGREGYCTYYATSLAVMARSIGIPARYVEGFILPDSRNADGTWTVTNAQAHAWAEIWFPGFGWLQFEATPIYYPDLYEEEVPGEQETPDLTVPDPEEEDAPLPDEPDPEELPRPDSLPEEEAAPEHPGSPWRMAGRVLLILLLLAAAGGGGYLLVRYRLRRYRTEAERRRRLPDADACVSLFSSILCLAGLEGHPIASSETAHGYADRMAQEPFFADSGIPLHLLADIFCRASYSSGRQVTEQERLLMEETLADLTLQMRRTVPGRLRYLFGRYLRFRF